MEEIIEDKQYEVLPIRNNVVFPGVMMPIAVSKESSLNLLNSAQSDGSAFLVLTQKDSSITEPTENDLYHVGTYAKVLQVVPVP